MSMKDYYAFPSLVDLERKRRGITKDVSTVEDGKPLSLIPTSKCSMTRRVT